MKILIATEMSMGMKYFTWVLDNTNYKYKIIDLKKYLKISEEPYDLIIYQPSPLENNPSKFNKKLINKTDDKFMSSKKRKLLCDCHPGASVDGFSRLKTDIPRIKRCPHKDFPNVCLPITMEIRCTKLPSHERDIDISCKTRLATNPMRVWVKNRLYKMGADVKYDGSRNRLKYRKHLERVKVSVCPSGHGETAQRNLESMWHGACMVCDEFIEGIKLLPCANIVEGKDYVTFNENNLEEVVNELLNNSQKRQELIEYAHNTFCKGYPAKNTAKLFTMFMKDWQ
ncbi:MAG: glycosyltransferase [Desulfobacterales bacterium]